MEFVHSVSEWLRNAAFGPLPGWLVIMLLGALYIWITCATFRHGRVEGELAHGDVHV